MAQGNVATAEEFLLAMQSLDNSRQMGFGLGDGDLLRLDVSHQRHGPAHLPAAFRPGALLLRLPGQDPLHLHPLQRSPR